jgi:DNA-binding NarL/FixJ family response regulator
MADNSKIRILLVEDHPLYRVGLRMALSYSESDFTIVEESKNVKQAIDFIQQHPNEIDVMLLDYFLPDGNGMDVVDAARQYAPDMKILLISADTNNPEIVSLMEKGINGFISKDVTPQELSLVITSIYRGHDYFDKTMLEQIENSTLGEKEETFSERELDIVRLSAQGLTAKQIADKLRISPRTVEKHKDRIFARFCFKSTVEMVNYAVRKGLV